MKRVFDSHDYAWKLIGFAVLASYGYLFWAISNAAHVSLVNL